jgi:hypothetical protein
VDGIVSLGRRELFREEGNGAEKEVRTLLSEDPPYGVSGSVGLNDRRPLWVPASEGLAVNKSFLYSAESLLVVGPLKERLILFRKRSKGGSEVGKEGYKLPIIVSEA